ncbi:exodeoxyribonuclease V subunit beta [Neobacillus mesonae]|uniref:UvrD-helicase domain-containing protein n=1 Tax=Neobacillus mesonae TaxID=1193713 RepID=UPI00204205FE|nr:UvrD-helicase domain-containing protein [Neobacillus mesonae]MCM3570312.1 UvrD-helicase domain-containing protein [Neobacillus mesonae]
MNYNQEQSKAIFGDEPLIVVSAGAGSGKTRVLTERYVHLCELKLQSLLGYTENTQMGAETNEIVTLTFTEDAALEMRSRIRKSLLGKLKNAKAEYPNSMEAETFWKKQIEGMETAVISTFHSFCQRIIQENSLEADLFPHNVVLDNIQSSFLKSEIFTDLIKQAEQDNRWQALLKSINKWSLKDCLYLVYGKIREYEMGGLLKDTLNVEAMAEIWRNEAESHLQAFEQDFYRFFQSESDNPKLSPANQPLFYGPRELFEKGLHGEELLNGLKIKWESVSNKVPKTLMAQNPSLYTLLGTWLDVRVYLPYQLLGAVLFDFEELLVSFHQEYNQRKREMAALDFSDLQQQAIALIDNPAIQPYYSTKFKHFLVDEMQDTNQLQLRMIEKINPAYRFIVGDGKQSIYRFRGADVQIFNGLMNQAKVDSGCSFIDMNTNYRTCDSIIRFINFLFGQEELMGVREGESADLLYKTAYSPMTAFRNEERAAKRRVEYIKVSEEQENSADENQYMMLARRMAELERAQTEIFDKDEEMWRPVEWRDMAVLIASRTNLTTLELSLQAYDIPYNVYGGLGFYERQEVIDFLSLLQWLNKPFEPLYMMSVLRGPLFGVTMEEFLEIQYGQEKQENLPIFIYGNKFIKLKNPVLQKKLETFCQLYEKWVPFYWSASNRKRLLKLFEESGLKKMLLLQKNNLMKIKNVEKLIETISTLHAVSMDEMLNQISILADLSKKEGDAEVELAGGNFVHIMTVHGSKGLEFPVVFVPNLSKGIPAEKEPFQYDYELGLTVNFNADDESDPLGDPIKVCSPNFKSAHSKSSDQAVEESKRLYYVALTRARDLLILSSKDKGNKNTWYTWLENALQNSPELMELIEIKEGIPEQKAVKEFKEPYEGPKVKLERNIPVTFSVSEVMSYIAEPDEFLNKHLLKLGEDWLEETEFMEEFKTDDKLSEDSAANLMHQVDPRTLGTIVHRICELLDKGYSEKDAYREAFSIMVQDEHELYMSNVKPLIQSYQNKEFGKPIENEWAFVLELDGVQILGEIDKVVQKKGKLEVLDLKTNRIHDNVEELIQYYRPQLYLYKMAYEHQNQTEIDKMSLVFLRDKGKGVYEIEYEPSFEKHLRDTIQEMARLKKEAAYSG